MDLIIHFTNGTKRRFGNITEEQYRAMLDAKVSERYQITATTLSGKTTNLDIPKGNVNYFEFREAEE